MIHQLTKTDTALVVVDVQERLLTIMDSAIAQQMIQNINLLSQMFTSWNAPIIVTEQYVKGLGHTSPAVKQHLAHIQPIEKVTFSCCDHAAFNEQLAAFPTKNLVLVGIEAHICVLQTVLQLLEKGVQVTIPVDAVQSSTKLRWKTGLHVMRQAGAVLSTTESILFQLVKRADTEDFKKLLNLIKALTGAG